MDYFRMFKVLLLCFRLHDSKTPMVSNTAAATLRQMVVQLFEKATNEHQRLVEDSSPSALAADQDTQDPTFVARYSAILPQISALKPSSLDAFLLFQDLCLLTNGDKPVFLRLEYLNRPFGLELIESILMAHHALFVKVDLGE